MGIIVSKFGGSSVAEASGFRRVHDIIAARRGSQYIILSAPGKRNPRDQKITDLLCHAQSQCACGKDGADGLKTILDRYEEIIRELSLSVDAPSFFSALQNDVRRSQDHAASRGEFFCAKLFAEFMNLPFVDAADLIHFDERGQISAGRTRAAIRAMAKRFSCAIIPGFYGSMPDGSIKTFSRGGSDITGALVAAALSADCYENWTDVDGLMSADPVLCPNAVAQPLVSYRQMCKIAEAGAQVLHPSCLAPVRDAGIPTILRNTFAPEKHGTYISDAIHETVPCVCAQPGKRIVELERLSAETQSILREISPRCFHMRDGQEALLLSSIGSTESVCVVTAFGLSESAKKLAVRALRPLATSFDDEALRLAVPEWMQPGAVQVLHNLLS